MSNRKGMPNKKEIFTFWKKEFDINYDYDIFSGWCFMCKGAKTLSRCHILAVSDGGANTVDNLHLLCSQCHELTEGLGKKGDYWKTFFDPEIIRKIRESHLSRYLALAKRDKCQLSDFRSFNFSKSFVADLPDWLQFLFYTTVEF